MILSMLLKMTSHKGMGRAVEARPKYKLSIGASLYIIALIV
jgi:hypothetical protein